MDSIDVWMLHRGMAPVATVRDTTMQSGRSMTVSQALLCVKDTVLVVTSSLADEMFSKIFDKG